MQKLLFILAATSLLVACKNETKAPREVKQYSIEQFFQTENIGGGSFNKDENKVLVNSNRSKIFNVYELSLADTTMSAKTNSTVESFFALDYVPGTDHFLYAADKGGNENDHIYLQRTDGSVKDLTPGEKEKANFFGWTRDKKTMYYGSNVRNPQFFDVYKMDTVQLAT
jgi:Tol biopolymer transport system component